MRQTLLIIPHDIAGIPVFGLGWLLAAWGLGSICLIIFLVRRQGWNADTRSYIPLIGLLGGVIALLVPFLEQQSSSGEIIGLPIRGYGVLLLLGVLFGVGLAVQQAQKEGVRPETIFSLAFAMFVCGIAGARLLYVAMNWKDFYVEANAIQTIVGIFKFTEGGLVVYGSLIGALLAAVAFMVIRGLPALATMDLIAAPMLLGLALGRIGCLLNGCCWGGLCDASWAIEFPPASPPYMDQLQDGTLLGMRLGDRADEGFPVVDVKQDSLTWQRGIRPGDVLVGVQDREGRYWPLLTASGVELREFADGWLEELDVAVTIQTPARTIVLGPEQLPPSSLPVHPTQIYAAVHALLLCLLLVAFYPYRRFDGAVLALLLTTYPPARFLLEAIRNDESGLAGTSLTLSQWVSLALFLAGVLLWAKLLLVGPRQLALRAKVDALKE